MSPPRQQYLFISLSLTHTHTCTHKHYSEKTWQNLHWYTTLLLDWSSLELSQLKACNISLQLVLSYFATISSFLTVIYSIEYPTCRLYEVLSKMVAYVKTITGTVLPFSFTILHINKKQTKKKTFGKPKIQYCLKL